MKIAVVNPSIYDYLCSTLIEGLNELGHELLCSESSNYGTSKGDAEFVRFAEVADIIIVSNNHGARPGLLYSVKNEKKIFIDGADTSAITANSDVRYKAIFKRELCRAERDPQSKSIFPLPFAAEKRYFAPDVDKNILVSFVANMTTNPMRYSVHKRLSNLGHPGIVSGSTNERAYYPGKPRALPVDTPAYRNILARSLISVNVPGGGYDCARCWEILAAGCMLFTFDSDIIIPNGFVDGVDCATFASLGEFEEKLAYYVARPALAKDIAKRGIEKLLAHHTTAKRAAYFLEVAAKEVERSGYCDGFLNPEMKALEGICKGAGVDICSDKPPVMPGYSTITLPSFLEKLSNGDESVPAPGTLDFISLRHDFDSQAFAAATLQRLSGLLRPGGKIGIAWNEAERQPTVIEEGGLTPASIQRIAKEGSLVVQSVVPCVPCRSFVAILIKP